MMQHQKVLAVHCLQFIFENRLIGKWLGFEPCDSFNYWWLDLCFMDHYSWYKSTMTIMMMMMVMNRNRWLYLWWKSHTQEVKVDTSITVLEKLFYLLVLLSFLDWSPPDDPATPVTTNKYISKYKNTQCCLVTPSHLSPARK